MAIETNPENTIYGSYGEFYSEHMADWTDEDWQAYDRHVGQEVAEWEAQTSAEAEIFADYDDEPPF